LGKRFYYPSHNSGRIQLNNPQLISNEEWDNGLEGIQKEVGCVYNKTRSVGRRNGHLWNPLSVDCKPFVQIATTPELRGKIVLIMPTVST
jgi:hypothetical protein